MRSGKKSQIRLLEKYILKTAFTSQKEKTGNREEKEKEIVLIEKRKKQLIFHRN